MLDESSLVKFKQALRGRLIRPEDPSYNSARAVWNGMIDRRPAMIVRCADSQDVIQTVKFARQSNLPVSVRGGGHGVAGKAVSDDAIMIDLSLLNSVDVDPDSRIAHVGGGATLGDLDKETQAHGLATTGGLVSETGIAGLTLGGGIGYLARRFGLTLDNLVSAKVVTADGELLHADNTTNQDLFWAIRGGGGNFGVVTSFSFQLHQVGPEVVAAQIFYPFEQAERVLRSYRDLMATAPDELSCYALAVNIPPVEPFPEEHHGKTAIVLVGCYTGETKDGLALFEPLKNLGDPIVALVSPMPYTTLQQSFDAGTPKGQRYYWKAHYFEEISDDAIAKFVELANSLPGAFSIAGFEPMGGAINRVNSTDTAFAHRDASFSFGIWAGWSDPGDDKRMIAWAREFHEAMKPYSTGGAYFNYLDRDDEDLLASTLGLAHQRLREIKAKYDPDNFFRLNQNIKPQAAG
jgi:FAD/FMN-containing dehydrogenase